MTMQLTKHQQEMLDGKLGEAKKFCMEKLADFGEAIEAKEMVDLVLVLNCCPIYSKDRQAPETKKKLEMYDLGHSPLYDPIFAMKDAFKKAKCQLLEPIMKVECTTPDEYQGDIMGDLNRRRGKIGSIEVKGNLTMVQAEVPLAEMFGYATAIRSLSKGRSSYSMEPSHFEQVPQQLVAAVLDQKETK